MPIREEPQGSNSFLYTLLNQPKTMSPDTLSPRQSQGQNAIMRCNTHI
jgi:hypothetical protein